MAAEAGWWRAMQAVGYLHAAQFADACRIRIESVFASSSFQGQHQLYEKQRSVHDTLLRNNLYTMRKEFDEVHLRKKSLLEQRNRQRGSDRSINQLLDELQVAWK